MERKYEVKSRIKVAFRAIYNQMKRWKFPDNPSHLHNGFGG